MKNKFQFLVIRMLPLIFTIVVIGAGCHKENDEDMFLEIFPDSDVAIIQRDVEGIVFEFYLLNEEGVASTVFNEGENFSFYFSVTNNRNEKFYFYPGYALSYENNFCEVFNSDNKSYGKPFILGVINLIGIGGFPFDTEAVCFFKQPWSDNRDSIWRWGPGHFTSTFRERLPKGNYYTSFSYPFEFEGESSKYSYPLQFKINFMIK
jgi:hypothetical protein